VIRSWLKRQFDDLTRATEAIGRVPLEVFLVLIGERVTDRKILEAADDIQNERSSRLHESMNPFLLPDVKSARLEVADARIAAAERRLARLREKAARQGGMLVLGERR
jgi:hypothetical protein